MKSSLLQSLYFTRIARSCSFTVASGPSDSIRFPRFGPYDERLGYTAIPDFVNRLAREGYVVRKQARLSGEMLKLYDRGLNMPSTEKQQAGIEIVDRRGRSMFSTVFPGQAYSSFDSIPGLLVKTLLYIEDRPCLDSTRPRMNPAVDWNRMAYAMLREALSKTGIRESVPGASTLATQMEKYRHSPEGLTINEKDKIKQMYCASLRAYGHGPNTLSARKDIVLQYMNTSPLGAIPWFGEVNGLGEGMREWYGVSFDSLNSALGDRSPLTPEKAEYFRAALGLLYAHRRPEYFLTTDTAGLSAKTNEYLLLLKKNGVISDSLYGAALRAHAYPKNPLSIGFQSQRGSRMKPVASVLDPFIKKLGLNSIYSLTHLDCSIQCTLDSSATVNVTRFFHRIKSDPSFLDSLGLRGGRMLDKGNPANIVYSMTLFERTGNANAARLQADSYDAPLDFNSGIRLDLGSTAKLRTLITYMEIIQSLHEQFSTKSIGALKQIRPRDSLTSWARGFFLERSDTTLTAMLDACLERMYSANPNERFFTAGGIQRFENFDKTDDSRTVSVREAFKFSVNLVFIRLMRDIVDYHIARLPESQDLDSFPNTARSNRYLSAFISYESGILLRDFYLQLRKVPPDALADSLVDAVRSSPVRLSAIYCSVLQGASPEGLKDFLFRHGYKDVSMDFCKSLYKKTMEFNWTDRGYTAHIHPLKLWAAWYMARSPSAQLSALKTASVPYLHEIYNWIFSPKRISFQQSRVRIMREMEAFISILASWRRLGYPFAEMTPSYASAIGASADRPLSLTQLAGIIQNNGLKCPEKRVESIAFGRATPYETELWNPDTAQCQQLLSPEIASRVRACMIEVVRQGTAARASKAFDAGISVGGKTGTGDHRRRHFNRSGELTGEQYVDRSAVFVFLIGDRFYGTITAAVLGPKAQEYDFTSSYPVKLFACLAPQLVSIIKPGPLMPQAAP
jgi:membrane peptidoglycan carboxypeptidase